MKKFLPIAFMVMVWWPLEARGTILVDQELVVNPIGGFALAAAMLAFYRRKVHCNNSNRAAVL